MKERIVLAYSGGLDTSVAIPWLTETRGAEVIAVTLDRVSWPEIVGTVVDLWRHPVKSMGGERLTASVQRRLQGSWLGTVATLATVGLFIAVSARWAGSDGKEKDSSGGVGEPDGAGWEQGSVIDQPGVQRRHHR